MIRTQKDPTTGEGRLHDTVSAVAAAAGVGASVHDTWLAPSPPSEDGAWLAVHTEVNRVVIGPLVRPGVPGCPRCVELRRGRVDDGEIWREPLRAANLHQLTTRPPEALDPLAAEIVADAAAQLIATELRSNKAQRQVVDVDVATLEAQWHGFLPDPLCEACGSLPGDDPESVQHVLRPQPKLVPFGARIRDVLAEFDDIRALYVDPFSGLIKNTSRGAEGGLVMSGATMPLRFDHLKEPGYGRSRDYRSAEATAILEALERYGGVAPGGRRSVVRGPYRELADRAVHPDVFGRHPDESYNDPSFRYQRFDPDAAIWWVWAHSFAQGRAQLVPEALAYYYCHRMRPGDPVSYYEVSNGCALGSSWEEATLHGLMETVERDAFLATWYTRMVPPTIDLGTCTDRQVPGQAAAIRAETGYDVFAFDITTDWGIPAVWVMAVHPDRRGPSALCTAGAGLDPERALLNAMNELGPILADVVRRFRTEESHAQDMVSDPFAVITMPDHSALYAHPDAFKRLEFLFDGPTIGIEDVGGAGRLRPDERDLSVDLDAAVQRIGEVLVVDQSTDEHLAGGFSCVKVLVPGAVPMTFGYRNRRIDGLDRLIELPRRMGRLDRDLRRDELNPDPHPFP